VALLKCEASVASVSTGWSCLPPARPISIRQWTPVPPGVGFEMNDLSPFDAKRREAAHAAPAREPLPLACRGGSSQPSGGRHALCGRGRRRWPS
jgi:hypothetical protein